MADNTTLDPGAGGDTIRDKDRAGVKTPVVALDLNPAGAETLMSGAMPVTDNGGSLTVDGTVTADTELPAAVALATGMANPTAPQVGSHGLVWNGATWDRETQPLTDTQLRASAVPISGAVTNTVLSVVGGGVQATAQRVTIASDSTGVVAVTDNGGNLSIDDGGNSITVDAPVATPVAARLSDGAAFYDGTKTGQLPAALAAGGGLKVEGVAGGVAQPVSGTVTANAGTGPFPVSDNAGSLTVDAPVGTPAFVRLSDGSAAITTLPVSIATAPVLVTGSALIGDVGIKPRTSGGYTTFHLVSAATTNATNVKASAGQLFGWYIFNNATTSRKVALHNTAGTPTAGASIFFSITIPAGSAANVFSETGIAFGTGIAISTVTEIADAGTTAVAVDDLNINIFYS